MRLSWPGALKPSLKSERDLQRVGFASELRALFKSIRIQLLQQQYTTVCIFPSAQSADTCLDAFISKNVPSAIYR